MRDLQDGNAEIRLEGRSNYASKIQAGKDLTIDCYSRKQLACLYPKGEFEVIGEYSTDSGGGRIGSFVYKDKKYPLYAYKSSKRLRFSEKGYAACDAGSNAYIAILKNVLAPRLISLFLCIGLALALVLVLPGSLNREVFAPSGVDLEEGAVDWNGTLPADTGGVTEGIRIPGYKSISIAANVTDVKVSFVNPEKNNCYFVISLILADTGETIYKSKMIKPGLGLYDITLSRALEPGTYDAIVNYDTFSMTENPTPLNGASINIDLIVA